VAVGDYTAPRGPGAAGAAWRLWLCPLGRGWEGTKALWAAIDRCVTCVVCRISRVTWTCVVCMQYMGRTYVDVRPPPPPAPPTCATRPVRKKQERT